MFSKKLVKFFTVIFAIIGAAASVITLIVFFSEEDRDMIVTNQFFNQSQRASVSPDLLIRNAALAVTTDEMQKGPLALKGSFVDWTVTFSNRTDTNLNACILHYEYKLSETSGDYIRSRAVPWENYTKLDRDTVFRFRTEQLFLYRLDESMYHFMIPRNQDIELEFESAGVYHKPVAARVRAMCEGKISNWYMMESDNITYNTGLNFGNWYYKISAFILWILSLMS